MFARYSGISWFRRITNRRISAIVGAVIFLAVLLGCILVPVFSPYGVNDLVDMAMLPPSAKHPFGTDIVGRDVFVRTFAGGRVDLMAATIIVAFHVIVGTIIGTWAGSTQLRWIDTIIMRLIDAIMSIPIIVMLLAIIMVIGVTTSWGPAPAGLPAVMVAMMAFGWAFYARLTRAQALVYRQSDFVAAARVAGLSQSAIVLRHIAPGVGRLSMSYAVGDVVGTVVLLASLPFLGAGVQAPNAEWGAIMYEGRGFLAECWWVTLFPGLIVVITGLGLSFVADAILDSRKDR